MSQRPSIKKPTPLSQPVSRPAASTDPFGGAAGGAPDAIMGGVNIPQFSKEMQAEISPEAAPLWNFVTNHAPKIAAGVVSMVVIILAIAGWQWYVEKGLREAQGQLGRIISIQDPARRMASLEAFMAKAPSKLFISTQLELAVTAMEMGNHAKAAEAYGKVVAEEEDTPLAFTARLNQAQALMRGGDYAGARALLETALASAPNNVKAALHQQIAEAAEAAGDKAGAVASLENALSALPPTDQEGAAYFRARIAQLKK
ncbi:MAG: tetratricopeptide repeat protein [Mailhella sp.]|nr:tetratricopeptide repeat protein [Mailhella sp.]MBQ8744593.1 tetratricopeptide repeat protein [Mailhella sp.]